MARTRFHDFRQEDSTLLFNDRLRAILPHGVYTGFNVVAGTSGGLYLDFEHDPDPDNTGSVLGSIVTPDGVIVHETEDQQDVVLGSLSSGTPNTHYVVASYTYNRALPNNDVVYAVLQGTSGSPPTPPVLTDDQVLLAIIDIPVGAVAYTSTGVRIKSVAKKNLWDISLPSLFKDFSGVLDPGIYDGIEMSVGSTALKVDLSAGTWITKESIKIQEAADQADLFTITPPAASNYKFIWVISAHKHEDITPYPDPDYFLVHGADAAVGTQASLPSDSSIVTAAEAISARYDNIVYCNKLGIIRIENRTGTYYIDYIKGESVIDRQSIIVYGAQAQSLSRSGKYYGYAGLSQAISDVYAISQSLTRTPERPFEILLDGEVKSDDAELRVPSNIALKGYGASARILSECATPVSIKGYDCAWDTVNATVSVSAGSTSPPTGYLAKIFAIQPTYQVGDELAVARFSRGDRVVVRSVGTATTYQGIFVRRTASWTFELFIVTAYNTDGNPTDLSMAIVKRNSSIENIEVGAIDAGEGILNVSIAEKIRLDKVVTNQLYLRAIRDCNWGHVTITHAIPTWTGTSNSAWSGKNNVIERITFYDTANAATVVFGTGSINERIDVFEYDNQVHGSAIVTLRPEFEGSCGTLRVAAYSGSYVGLYTSNQTYQNIIAPGCTIRTDSGSGIFVLHTYADTVNLQGTGQHILFVFVVAPVSILNTCTNPKNRILFSTKDTLQNAGQAILNPDEDRNLRMVSQANIAWNSTTGVLSWDAPLKFDIPWQIGYSSIAAGNATLSSDGDRLYADIDRDATGTSVATATVRTKANATQDRFYRNRVFVAVRDQGVIYLFDGTRIETSQTVKLGATPPPDSSVTWIKLADSALAFHNKFFRDYVSPEDNVGWENDIVFRNVYLRTMTYTIGTGIVQYSADVDLSNVRVGDVLIFRNTDATSFGTALTREPISEVNDSANYVRIAKGLSPVIGAAHIWNGAIARGSKAVTNDDLTVFTYTPGGGTPGRITWSTPLGFSQYQVGVGHLFVDSSGNKFRINDRDPSGVGAWITIAPNLRNIDTSTPTTKHHGSVELANNPYNIALSDLRVLSGEEFIPIDGYGLPDLNRSQQVLGSAPNFDAMERRFSTPHDDRVRVGVSSGLQRRRNGIDDGASSANPSTGLSPDLSYVEVTGVYTAVALVVSHTFTAPGTLMAVYVDNEYSILNSATVPFNATNTCTGMYMNRYMLITGLNARRLGYGIHTVRYLLPPGAQIAVRGVLLINDSFEQAHQAKVHDSPGKCVQSGGVFSVTAPSFGTNAPSPPTGWDKGSRVVRYINDGSFAWATSYVRNFIDTGNVSNASADITSVANPSYWRVGDLLMVVDAVGGVNYIRRITVIAGSTITVDSAIGFTETGTTLYFYGTTYLGGRDRSQEEILASYSLLEFCMPGPLNDNRGMAAQNATPRPAASFVGARLSDLTTVLNASDQLQNNEGALKIAAAGDKVRFWFVGTGFSIGRRGAATVDLKVDGVSVGTTVAAPDGDDDQGGLFVCGELPYCSHTVEISNPSTDLYIERITLWQPVTPALPSGGMSLWEANMVCTTESMFDLALVNSPVIPQLGTINQDCGRIAVCSDTGFEDKAINSFNTTTAQTIHDLGVGGGVIGGTIDISFYGDQITLMTDVIVKGGINPIAVEVLDKDLTFKSPAALTGIAVVGPASFLASSITVGERTRWLFSEIGYHTLRIVLGNNGDNFALDSIEVHPPFHCCRSKHPVSIDHYLPHCLGGLDTRPLTPLRSDFLPKAQSLRHTGAQLNVGVATSWDNQNPFIFYSRGGLVTVRALAEAMDAIAGPVCPALFIDGVAMTPSQSLASAADITIAMQATVLLQPGMHYAYLDGSVTNMYTNIMWEALEVEANPANVPGRGLGVPFLGPNQFQV